MKSKTKSKSNNKPRNCLCGSAIDEKSCCLPIIKGESVAQTAEQLMRSRYTAYVLGDESYVLASWYHSQRPADLSLDENMRWSGLKVIDVVNDDDTTAYVEFVAGFNNNGNVGQMHERSRFFREGGYWFYVDGEQLSNEEYVITPPGRNDPCCCGSGRKYKKCCAGL